MTPGIHCAWSGLLDLAVPSAPRLRDYASDTLKFSEKNTELEILTLQALPDRKFKNVLKDYRLI